MVGVSGEGFLIITAGRWRRDRLLTITRWTCGTLLIIILLEIGEGGARFLPLLVVGGGGARFFLLPRVRVPLSTFAVDRLTGEPDSSTLRDASLDDLRICLMLILYKCYIYITYLSLIVNTLNHYPF